MHLPTAFPDAMPSPAWPLAARHGTLVAFLATDAWTGWMPEAMALLSVEERERVQRKRRASDRETTALAYACHRLLLSAVLDCAPGDVPLGRDALGCPMLRGETIRTSLSHADGLVALAVSGGGPVGVDIEPAGRVAGMPEIAARVCHPEELDALAGLPEPDHARALLSLWVRKEALLKAAGIGMEVEMNAFRAPVGRMLPLPGGIAGSAVLRVFDDGNRCLAAVAGPPGEVASAWLSPRPGAA